MCVTVQLLARYQYFHLHSDLPWSYALNIATNPVRPPQAVNPILPSVRTLNSICTAEITVFYTNHSATECYISVHILYTFLYTFCTHFCTNFCTHLDTFLCTLCTHFCTHSLHILYTFLNTFPTHFCTHFCTHSVCISMHICTLLYSPSK